MTFEPLITPDLVALDQSVQGGPRGVIDRVARLVADAGRAADPGGLRDALWAREQQIATGLPGGIAIPHCRSAAVRTASLAVLRLSAPVDFGAEDGKPADLIVAIAAPEESGSAHMKLLAQLSRALVRPDFVAALRAATTREQVAELVGGAVRPPTGHATQSSGERPLLLAITACPTGIAHTYMAAEALETAARARGADIRVETQGSGGVTPFTAQEIAQARALIVAADARVEGRERFAGLPVVESGVNRAISDGPAMVDEALRAARKPGARAAASAAAGAAAPSGDGQGVGWGRRIQQALMTGVSYMIPFVAAGGLLTALGFLVGGYDVAFVSNKVALGYSLWDLPGRIAYESGGAQVLTSHGGLALYLGAVLAALGSASMGFLVAALSGYIAYGLAGRPGIAPGFVGGAVSVLLGAGFIGGLLTGLLAGLIALWLGGFRPPRWLAGLMPVVIIPLIDTLLTGAAMVLVLGRPLAAFMTALQHMLGGMSGASAVVLGVVLGLMMCFDLGGPVNKAAYLFATAGLSTQSPASWHIMAAVMAAGMVPPLAMALSTVVRPALYTRAERENGTAAWLLGASFISEGAIPFAAADPLRVIPSMMAGGAVTGAISMALGVGSRAPHGGIFVLFAIDPIWGYVVSIVAGTLVAAAAVTLLKQAGARAQASPAVAR